MFKIIKICLIISFISISIIKANNTTQLLQNAKEYKPSTYYEPSNRGGYLGLSIGLIGISSLAAAGLLYIMPESVTKWDRDDINDIFNKWKKRTKQGPIVDSDELWLNYIAHPYFGALYYLQPRMAGFDWNVSALFSFVTSSFFWEYGIEGFAEIPSWQDIIITPAFGALLGEGFYQLIRYIQMNNNELFGSWWLGKSIIWILDPIGSLIYSTGLGEAFGVYNINDSRKPEFISSPILPNGKGGFGLSLMVRF